MTSIKMVLISTGIAAISLFLKSYVPVAVDVSVSRFPILWSSFLSWLKPPYVFLVINVIVTILVASSRYYQSIGDHDAEHKTLSYEPIVSQAYTQRLDMNVNLDADITVLPPIIVSEAERLGEEKEISGVVNCSDEFAECEQMPPTMVESENLLPAEKPLDSASSGHRKSIKANPKGTTTREK